MDLSDIVGLIRGSYWAVGWRPGSEERTISGPYRNKQGALDAAVNMANGEIFITRSSHKPEATLEIKRQIEARSSSHQRGTDRLLTKRSKLEDIEDDLEDI